MSSANPYIPLLPKNSSDPNNDSPNPNMGPLTEAPFYAMPIYPGALGTKGGVKVNQHGQALGIATGTPVSGLYAAGNVMAGITGAGYPGAGCTISSAMTFGYIASNHATVVVGRVDAR